MGIETALIAAAAVSIGGSVIGGLQANKESKRQARIARAEAEERAKASERRTDKIRSQQLVGFLKSGVRIAGTPEEVLAETEQLGAEEAASIRRSGEATARGLRAQGRQALFSGISSGFSTGIGAFGGLR